jgi:hypothetical protein
MPASPNETDRQAKAAYLSSQTTLLQTSSGKSGLRLPLRRTEGRSDASCPRLSGLRCSAEICCTVSHGMKEAFGNAVHLGVPR